MEPSPPNLEPSLDRRVPSLWMMGGRCPARPERAFVGAQSDGRRSLGDRLAGGGGRLERNSWSTTSLRRSGYGTSRGTFPWSDPEIRLHPPPSSGGSASRRASRDRRHCGRRGSWWDAVNSPGGVSSGIDAGTTMLGGLWTASDTLGHSSFKLPMCQDHAHSVDWRERRSARRRFPRLNLSFLAGAQ